MNHDLLIASCSAPCPLHYQATHFCMVKFYCIRCGRRFYIDSKIRSVGVHLLYVLCCARIIKSGLFCVFYCSWPSNDADGRFDDSLAWSRSHFPNRSHSTASGFSDRGTCPVLTYNFTIFFWNMSCRLFLLNLLGHICRFFRFHPLLPIINL